METSFDEKAEASDRFHGIARSLRDTSQGARENEILSVCDGSALSATDRESWNAMQEANPDLRNPYFRVEFMEAVARVRPNVKVAILRRNDRPVLFWPFQEIRPGTGGPVGEKIGCLHGVIAPPETTGTDIGKLARQSGLRRWRFDHLIASQSIFRPYFYEVQESPFMDLSRGFESYLEERRQQGHTNRNILNASRKLRNLSRDAGKIRFEYDCRDQEVLQTLIDWKKEQMRQTGHRDLFVRSPWIIPLLTESLNRPGNRFRGMASAFFVAGQPAAIFFGFRSEKTLHGLFIGYDDRFSRYSPGAILITELARNANSLGLERIDLGKGNEFYKQTFKSGSLPVAVGAVEKQTAASLLRLNSYRLKTAIARSPLGNPARGTVGRILRSYDRLKK